MIMDTGRHRKPTKLTVCLGICSLDREGAARRWELLVAQQLFSRRTPNTFHARVFIPYRLSRAEQPKAFSGFLRSYLA